MSKLQDYKRQVNGAPKQVFADGGAITQDGRKPIKLCECGEKVVFVQSKAGKWYLVNCFPYANNSDSVRSESYYYIKSVPHFKTCSMKKEQES